MRSRLCAVRLIMATACLCLCLPVLGQAQISLSDQGPLSYTFSYSIIDTDISTDVLVQSLQRDVLTTILEPAEKVFAIWLPVEKPDDAPFAGLASNQIGLMLAWPDGAAPEIAALDRVLGAHSGVTAVVTRMFQPVYLVDGLNIPTDAGFYVHREEQYGPADVSAAVRLSEEAWVTWEPAFGVKVIGLFREIPVAADHVNLNRIVWYPSYPGWLGTRNNTIDPESARRFRERGALQIEGSGIAIATDRLLP